ncbi:MAG: histidine phosphatase family protein [Dechloromonas sp.]|nr:histidine phosphatase family protein [Dechloromonas sp.]
MVEIPSKQPTRLCLIRHGETEWNAERRIQGQIDIALNTTGLLQAEAAGRWLRNSGIEAIYASDLKRAWMTAQAIGRHLALQPVSTPALRERRYGIFEGLTYAEAASRFPAGYAAFEGRNADYDFEQGESLKAMYDRVTKQLQALVAAHPGQVLAVVVHGGVLDVVNRFVRGLPLEMPRDFLIPNAGLNWISTVDGQWTVESWGETSHLAAGALDELPS